MFSQVGTITPERVPRDASAAAPPMVLFRVRLELIGSMYGTRLVAAEELDVEARPPYSSVGEGAAAGNRVGAERPSPGRAAGNTSPGAAISSARLNENTSESEDATCVAKLTSEGAAAARKVTRAREIESPTTTTLTRLHGITVVRPVRFLFTSRPTVLQEM